jgi:hypothetical protein
MERMHAHLLAEILAADGIAVRWARLGILDGKIDAVWCLIVAMEILYIAAHYTNAKAHAAFAFFATYAVVLTVV